LEGEGFFEPEEEELLLVFLVDFLTLSSSAESSVSSPSLESGWISDFLLALALPELENLVELDFCLRLLFLAGDFSSASSESFDSVVNPSLFDFLDPGLLDDFWAC